MGAYKTCYQCGEYISMPGPDAGMSMDELVRGACLLHADRDCPHCEASDAYDQEDYVVGLAFVLDELVAD